MNTGSNPGVGGRQREGEADIGTEKRGNTQNEEESAFMSVNLGGYIETDTVDGWVCALRQENR